MPCKIKYKDRDMSYAEFASSMYEGELAALINSGVIDSSKLKGSMPASIAAAMSAEPAPKATPAKSPLPPLKLKDRKNRPVRKASVKAKMSNNAGAVNSAFSNVFKQFPNLTIKVDAQSYLNASADPASVPIYDSYDDLIGFTNAGEVFIDPSVFDRSSRIAALSSVWLKVAETVDPAIYKSFMSELKKPENRSYIDSVEATGRFTEEKDILNQAASNMINDAAYQRENRTLIQKFADFLRDLFGIKRDFMKMTAKDFAETIAKELNGNYPVSMLTSKQLDELDPSDARISIDGGVYDEEGGISMMAGIFDSKGNAKARSILNYEGGVMAKAADKVSGVRLISPQKFSSFKTMLSYMFGGKYFGRIDNLNKQKDRVINARMRELDGKVKSFAKQFKKEFKGASDANISRAIKYINGIMSSTQKRSWVMMNARNGVLSDEMVDMIQSMRDDIDAMSMEVNKFIDPQSRLSAVISGNLGFYMNRSYAVHNNGSWNKAMFPSGMKTSVFSDKRTPEMQAVYDEAFDFLKNQYPELSSSEIDLMLKQFSKVDKDEAEDAFIESNGKVGKAYSDFLKARKDMPDQIRAFLGEYKDPLTNFYNTMANMIQFAENRKFLQSLADLGDNKIFFDSPSSEFNSEIAGTKNEYSPLYGKYTSKEIADYLSGTDKMWKIPVLRKLASVWKMNQTVLSPRSWVRNFHSNFFIHVYNGHIFGPVKYMAKGFNYAKKNVADSDDSYILSLMEAGVIGSGVEAGVLRRVIKEAWGDMDDMTLDPEQRYNSFTERLNRAVSWTRNKSIDVYEAADNIHKIIAFESEKYDVKYMFPSLSDKEIFDMAVERFKETNIVYEKAPDIIKRLSASPILGTFPTFTAEAMRIAVTIPMRAVKDINEGAKKKNARQALVGIKRLVGFAAGATMMNVIANLILSGFDQPEEDDDVARVLYEGSPEYAKNSSKIIINKTPKGYKMVDLDWLNPLNFIQKSYNTWENTGSFEPNDSRLLAVTSTLLESFIGPEAVLAVGEDIIKNEDSSKR